MQSHLQYNYLDTNIEADQAKKEVPLIEENEAIHKNNMCSHSDIIYSPAQCLLRQHLRQCRKYIVLIGEDPEITEKLSDIDLLVIDAEYFSQNDIARLRENGIHEIYSYINIGSIESFRSYDTDFEKYTLGDYENWPEEKWIDVSAPEWQACTASRVDALVQKGVDGFFVDNTDVYYNYPQESIYDGILTILDYMNHTGRKIMINGGDCFVKKYLTTEKNVLIDGVNQENVFTAYDFSKDIYTKNDQSTREYYTEYLDLAMSHGCTAYALEYATVPAIRRQAAAYAGKHGYICCISDNIGLCLEK